ncbi:hypothetical protein C8Q76DRAFT_688009 [Earliella scabrosa]|nr:hypothetical protein C8Q76DRAFT_688009 [Earliella scabrosa]
MSDALRLAANQYLVADTSASQINSQFQSSSTGSKRKHDSHDDGHAQDPGQSKKPKRTPGTYRAELDDSSTADPAVGHDILWPVLTRIMIDEPISSSGSEIVSAPFFLHDLDVNDAEPQYSSGTVSRQTSPDPYPPNFTQGLSSTIEHIANVPQEIASLDPPHAQSSAAAFTSILLLFRYDHLHKELLRFRQIASLATDKPIQSQGLTKPVDEFMEAFDSGRQDASLPLAISRMWRAHGMLRKSDDVLGLHVVFYRRRIMMCSAAAWYWLTQYCRTRCHTILDQLHANNRTAHGPADWLERLCSDVYTDVKARSTGSYRPSDYISSLEGGQPFHVPCPRELESDFHPRVCEAVISIL